MFFWKYLYRLFKSKKKQQAIDLTRELSLPEQIAIAGLGLNPAGLKTLRPGNANCESWRDKLTGFLSDESLRQDATQEVVNADEVKIALSALQLITTGQFLIDALSSRELLLRQANHIRAKTLL